MDLVGAWIRRIAGGGQGGGRTHGRIKGMRGGVWGMDLMPGAWISCLGHGFRAPW